MEICLFSMSLSKPLGHSIFRMKLFFTLLLSMKIYLTYYILLVRREIFNLYVSLVVIVASHRYGLYPFLFHKFNMYYY